MANLFSYFTGKRDIKHSKFDMSFQNLFTSNFGELKPAACYEVLGGDTWKVAQNTLTKVAPMPAPAYARIKQNFYSFFVPNQIVWKYWNDFITNGTAYLDTYGNNQTNQEITNQWQQPSIMVNDLQLQTKLANGWALPVFRLSEGELVKFIAKLPYVWKAVNTAPDDDEHGHFDSGEIVLSFNNLQLPSDDELQKNLWSIYVATSGMQLPSIFENIPYVHPVWTLVKSVQGDFTTVRATLTYFAFCCDLHTCLLFYHWLNSDQYTSSFTEKTETTLISDSAITMDSHNTVAAWTNDGSIPIPESAVGSWWIGIRYFCDMFSDNPRLDEGPFILDKTSFRSLDGTGMTLNTFTAKKNLVKFQEFKYNQVIRWYDQRDSSYKDVVCEIVYQKAGFYGRMFGRGYYEKDESGNPLYIMTIWNGMVLPYVTGLSDSKYGTIAPLFEKKPDSIEDLEWVFAFDLDFLSCHCGQRFYYDNFSSFDSGSSFVDNVLKIGDNDYIIRSSDSTSLDLFISPFRSLSTPSVTVSDPSSLIGVSLIGSIRNSCDVFFPLYSRQNSVTTSPSAYIWNNLIYKVLDYKDISTQDSFALGYDAFGFMVYNAKQVCKLLDSFNIPLEGMTSRSWEDYAGELINCLPFMANSKIWNDYFRNKTTSSAELDFKHTNGVALLNYSRLRYLKILKGLNVPLSRQVLQLIDDNTPNSWVIPMCTAPRSGLGNYTVEFSSGDRFLEYTKNEFHYYNIQSYLDLFSLVSGFQITDRFVRKILNYVVKQTINNVTYIQLRGLLLENVYLPNYYNGLMRMKFQNFSKDYFSSAMLDPMHGANEVQIGDTISDLRTEIVEQNFWETFAMARSLKHAFESMIGVTPTHIEQDKPLLLGMDHMPVNIGEVIQTSQTTDSSPQGKRTGLAAAHGKAGLCKHYFNESGYLIVLTSFTVEQQYFQGLEHQWTPFESFLDYPWIQMAHIGNESIPLRELKWNPSGKYNTFGSVGHVLLPTPNYEGSKVLMDGRSSPLFIDLADRQQVYATANVVDKDGIDDDCKGFDEIFGYVPRNSNYKFKLDQLHGAFRNQMDYWQTFRKFYKKPMLTHEFVNWEFVADDGDLNRLFAVEDENISDKFYCDCYINALVNRPLPVVNIPSTK